MLRMLFSARMAVVATLAFAVSSGCKKNAMDYSAAVEGMAALQTDENELAVRKFLKAIEIVPKDGMLHARLGQAYLRLRRTAEAKDAFEQAAELLPDRSEPLELAATALVREGKFAQAEEALNRALSRSQRNGRILTSLALLKIRAGNAEGARIRLEQALEADPDYPPALYNLAWLNRERLGQPAAAGRLFEQYLQAAEDMEHVNKARLALAALTAAADGAGAVAADEMRNGMAAFERRDWAAAEDHFKRAISADGRSDTAYYNLGLVYQNQQRSGNAVEAFRQALRIRPDRLPIHYALAWSLWKNRDSAAASVTLEALLKRAPDHAQAHYLLAVIQSDDPARKKLAAGHLERYLQLDPNGVSAAEARRRLKIIREQAGG